MLIVIGIVAVVLIIAFVIPTPSFDATERERLDAIAAAMVEDLRNDKERK